MASATPHRGKSETEKEGPDAANCTLRCILYPVCVCVWLYAIIKINLLVSLTRLPSL